MPQGGFRIWQDRLRRLVCEHPDVYRDFIAGKYPSVRAAARAAGIADYERPARNAGREKRV
jgi:hypothetical protein